eukprot:scpid7962/ scgid5016/ Unconventional myosin-XV; Unconventional myosin-15
MGDSLHQQKQFSAGPPQPAWRRRSVPLPQAPQTQSAAAAGAPASTTSHPSHPGPLLQAPNLPTIPQAQAPSQQQAHPFTRPSLPTSSSTRTRSPPQSQANQTLSSLQQQNAQQQQKTQHQQQQAVKAAISSKTSSLSREVGTVPMQWASKSAQQNAQHKQQQPPIGPRPPAPDWHGESIDAPRLARSKSVYGGSGETIRLLRINQDLQERLGKSERQLEDERQNHIRTVRSMEGSLQEHRSHLQEERKVSGALNRDVQRLKHDLSAQAKMFERDSLALTATQREQLGKELKELRGRVADVQRCVSPLKQLSGSLRRSPTGDESRLSGSSLLSSLRRANQQLASLSGQLVTQRQDNDGSTQGASDEVLAEIYDLVQLDSAASEKEILGHLRRRLVHGHNVTMLGGITLVLNSFAGMSGESNAATPPLRAVYGALPVSANQLGTITQTIVNQLQDGVPSISVLLSGESGSGKTFASQLLVRLLFENASHGLLAEPFKHYAAAVTVLQPMITAQTSESKDSSRVGLVTELQLTAGVIVRSRFHAYFADQAHVFRSSKDRSMYRILSMMLASISPEDKVKLQIESLTQDTLKQLIGSSLDHIADVQAEYNRWKMCIARFGIPITDVLRVLMAVVLLSGIQFVLDSRSGSQLDVKGTGNELKLVASLLGVSPVSLYQALTTRTRLIRGQSLRSCSDPVAANSSRDALAQALYIRTLNAVIKRVNTMKQRNPPPAPKRKPVPMQKPASLAAEMKKTRRTVSDSDAPGQERPLPQIPKQPRSPPSLPPPPPLPDSRGSSATPPVQQDDGTPTGNRSSKPTEEESIVAKRRDTVITANLKLAGSNTKKPGITGASKSAPSASTAGAMTVAEDSGASATALGLGLASSGNFTHLGSQSVSVIDLFGFQGALSQASCRFQTLCCNVTAEALQQLYQSSVFKRSAMECRLERIDVMFEAEYDNRCDCFQLFTEQHSGIFPLMTKECAMPRIAVENFIGKLSTSHGGNPCVAAVDSSSSSFTIRHYNGKVTYNADAILEVNKDTIADDVVTIFQVPNCNFGFVSHLFSAETKMAGEGGNGAPSPRGMQYRITPQVTAPGNSDSNPNSLVRDFQTKLDALLYTLEQDPPHYIHCLKSNSTGAAGVFDESTVARQLRQLDVPDTLALFKYGYSHHWSVEKFNQRFSCVAHIRYQKASSTDLSVGILKSIDGASSAASLQGTSSSTTLGAGAQGSGVVCSDSKTSNLVWAVGEKLVLFSEVTLQLLEHRRNLWRERCVVKLQSQVRRWLCVRQWPDVKRVLLQQRSNPVDRSDTVSECTTISMPAVEHDSATCLHSAEGFSPPPLPKTRPYTVVGNVKVGFPQARKMATNYPEFGEPIFLTGQEVHLVGVSANRRGYIRVARGDSTVEVPHRFMRFEKNNVPGGEAVSLL